MAELPAWPWWLWAVYGVGALYFGLFVAYFLRFRSLARQVAAGVPGADVRHDAAIRGAPAGFYAKMLGVQPVGRAVRKGAEAGQPGRPRVGPQGRGDAARDRVTETGAGGAAAASAGVPEET